MKPVEPILPRGIVARRVTFAADQPEYNPLVALVEPNGRVHTRWQLSGAERQAVLDGACITLEVLTFNQPLQPLGLAVEGTDGLVEIPRQDMPA